MNTRPHLVTRRSIVVPDWEVSDRVGVLLQGLGLRPQTLSSPINPDVQCLNPGRKGALLKSESNAHGMLIWNPYYELFRETLLPGALVKFHVLVQYGLVGLGMHLKRQQ